MHTYRASNGTVFKYNPDLSEVRVNVKTEEIVDLYDLPDGKGISEVQIDGDDLAEFFAEFIRSELISELEQLSVVDLLKRFK